MGIEFQFQVFRSEKLQWTIARKKERAGTGGTILAGRTICQSRKLRALRRVFMRIYDLDLKMCGESTTDTDDTISLQYIFIFIFIFVDSQ
jgi:hypothetical protein